MGGKSNGVLPLLSLAAAAAAIYFTGGAAAGALAGAEGGAVAGGGLAGASAAEAAAAGATAAEGLAAGATAAEGAAALGTEAAAASAATGAELAGTTAATTAGTTAAEAATTGSQWAGAETLTAANSGSQLTAANAATTAAQTNSLDAFVAEHGLQFNEAGKLSLANSANASVAPTASQIPTPGPMDGVWSWVKANKDMVGLGLQGAGAVNSAVAGYQNAQAQEGALKVKAAEDALDMEGRARDAQLRLSQTLAAQNNFFQARGLATNGGSALSMINAAEANAERTMSSLYASQSLNAGVNSYARSRASGQKTGAMVGSLLDFGGAAADTFDIIPRRRRGGLL